MVISGTRNILFAAGGELFRHGSGPRVGPGVC